MASVYDKDVSRAPIRLEPTETAVIRGACGERPVDDVRIGQIGNRLVGIIGIREYICPPVLEGANIQVGWDLEGQKPPDLSRLPLQGKRHVATQLGYRTLQDMCERCPRNPKNSKG